MGTTHLRSNLSEQGDDNLTIDFNTGSFDTLTSDSATLQSATISDGTAEFSSMTVSASAGFNTVLVASAVLVATIAQMRMIRIDSSATSYYVKVYEKA